MPTPDGVQLKIERAKYHFHDLAGKVGTWIETNPYAYIRETEAESGDELFRFKPQSAMPAHVWSPIIGDCIHNLRSALDHLICALVVANRKKVYEGNQFPIYVSLERYKLKAPGCVQGVGKKAIKLIDSLNPYKGGNDGLWRLQMLDINDKHRGLIAVVGSIEGVTLDFSKAMANVTGFGDIAPMKLTVNPAVRCPVEDGDVIYRIPCSQIGKGHDHPEISFAPAFNEPGIIECEAIVPTLQQLGVLVEKTVNLFDPFFPSGMPSHASRPRPKTAQAPSTLSVRTLASGSATPVSPDGDSDGSAAANGS